jgi:hypothetical protein
LVAYLQQSPNFEPLHVYPVFPPHVASGETLRLGTAETLPDARVLAVDNVVSRVTDEVVLVAEVDVDKAVAELEDEDSLSVPDEER